MGVFIMKKHHLIKRGNVLMFVFHSNVESAGPEGLAEKFVKAVDSFNGQPFYVLADMTEVRAFSKEGWEAINHMQSYALNKGMIKAFTAVNSVGALSIKALSRETGVSSHQDVSVVREKGDHVSWRQDAISSLGIGSNFFSLEFNRKLSSIIETF